MVVHCERTVRQDRFHAEHAESAGRDRPLVDFQTADSPAPGRSDKPAVLAQHFRARGAQLKMLGR